MSESPFYRIYREDGTLAFRIYRENGLPHREDGPAWVEFFPDEKKNCELYYRRGFVHREDGPASIEYNNKGEVEFVDFYLAGVRIDFWDFYDKVPEENQKNLLKDWLPYV
jgi:hypothetical protein